MMRETNHFFLLRRDNNPTRTDNPNAIYPMVPGGYYIDVWSRMQPYLMGILLGYILFKTRGKPVKITEVSRTVTK